MPGARCTRSLACEMGREHTRIAPWVHRTDPAFPHAMVLTVSFVISPVIGLGCHRRLRFVSANLTPASRRQDHTTSPSASGAVRQQRRRRPSHPAPRPRRSRYAPLVGRDGVDYCGDLRREKTNIFFEMGLDRQITLICLSLERERVATNAELRQSSSLVLRPASCF